MNFSPSSQATLAFILKSLICLVFGLFITVAGWMIGATLGGNYSGLPLIRLGSFVRYEATGMIGSLVGYSLWLSTVSRWLLDKEPFFSFRVSHFFIIFLETTLFYELTSQVIGVFPRPLPLVLLYFFITLFFIVPLLSIYGWERIRKQA